MRLPGFTAEASHYETRECYRVPGAGSRGARGGRIYAAAAVSPPPNSLHLWSCRGDVRAVWGDGGCVVPGISAELPAGAATLLQYRRQWPRMSGMRHMFMLLQLW